ncbi:hypothetical protein SpCBS45565_g04733 [Spizellomyces sp. 'palustris']|nr:hypothetical protein SpCBS45565_g04733 [Spizellomyces sp. 'palustris']
MSPKVAQPAPPTKPPPAKPIGLAAELAQVKNHISELRANIEGLEKVFRENVSIRRAQFQPYAIFSSEIPASSLSGEEEYAKEMIARAKDELLRRSGQKKKMEEQQANQKLDSEEFLRNKTAETRRKFRQKESLLAAGPKFVNHFSCTNGDILHVHILTERLYVAFAANNYLEFWELPSTGEHPILRDIIRLSSLDIVTTVCDLFIEDATPIPEASASPTVTAMSSVQHSRRPSISRRPSVAGRRPTITSFAEIPEDTIIEDAQSIPPPRQNGSLWGETSSGGRKRMSSRTHRVIGNVPEEESAESVTEASGIEREEAIIVVAPSEEDVRVDEAAEPPPFTVMKHAFFLGCKSGMGACFEIAVAWDREADTLSYTHSISKTRLLSVNSIKISCFIEHEESIVCLVSHYGSDHVLAAYNVNLEDQWQCKGDVLRYTAKDKQLKVIAQTRLDTVKDVGKAEDERPTTSMSSGNTEDELFITAIAADDIHKHVLVAMRSGAILRLNCETIVTGGTKDKDKDKDKDKEKDPEKEPTPGGRRESLRKSIAEPAMIMPVTIRKDLFVAWCLDVQTLPSTSLPVARTPGTAPGRDEGQGKGQSRSMFMFRNNPDVVTKCMITFMHTTSNKPYLLLSCADGTLRMYPMDIGLATASPIVYTYADQDKERRPNSSEQALVWADVLEIESNSGSDIKQYLMAYTADGIFLIYNVADPSPLLESRILSNRAPYLLHDAIGTPSTPQFNKSAPPTTSRPTTTILGAPYPALRRCRQLDPSSGICAIMAGREWSLVNVKSLQGWDIKDVAARGNSSA